MMHKTLTSIVHCIVLYIYMCCICFVYFVYMWCIYCVHITYGVPVVLKALTGEQSEISYVPKIILKYIIFKAITQNDEGMYVVSLEEVETEVVERAQYYTSQGSSSGHVAVRDLVMEDPVLGQ